LDCGLGEFGGCEGTCDPMAASTGCAANRACVPTADGMPWSTVGAAGNGICAVGCSVDADCGSGKRCLGLRGFAIQGLCAPECTPGAGGCAGTCYELRPGAGVGACLADASCDPAELVCLGSAAGPSTCAALSESPAAGACLPGCFSQDSAACGAAGCSARNEARFHAGSCFGADTACDPVAQTGCAAAQSCSPLGGRSLGGSAKLCVAATGGVPEGADCISTADCPAGLLCLEWACRRPCSTGAPCASGTCVDLSGRYLLAQGSFGYCR
jgi:hypothetical protein